MYKRNKQYYTDLDFQWGFQGLIFFLAMNKVNIDIYIFLLVQLMHKKDEVNV